jgi:hypothetical protein
MAASHSRAKIGLGTKVIFTQTGFIGEIIEGVEGLGVERADFDATHMGVPTLDQVKTNRQKIPAGLAGINDMTLSLHFDPAVGLPALSDPETIELIFPRRKTESTPAKWSATGYLKGVSASIPVDNKMTARVTLGFTGDYTYTRPTLL